MTQLIRTVTVAWLVFLCVGTCLSREGGTRLTVGVAASAVPVMEELARRFEQASSEPVEIVISGGATGLLARQLREGAPFDLFVSADMRTPLDLEREGVLTSGSVVIYACGELVLWQPQGSANGWLSGVADLQSSAGVGMRVGIANPETAPYGLAARQVLTAVGVWNSIQPRLIIAENASQAYQFAHSGNVDCALLPASLLLSPGKGRRVPVPAQHYQPLVHGIGRVSASANKVTALKFYRFVLSGEQSHVFREFGFLPGK